MIRQELDSGVRVIGERFFHYAAPYAPRFPFRDVDSAEAARFRVREYPSPITGAWRRC